MIILRISDEDIELNDDVKLKDVKLSKPLKSELKLVNGSSDAVVILPGSVEDPLNSIERPAGRHDAEKQRIQMENNALMERTVGKEHLYKHMYMERYENGGGYVLHAYQDELSRLSPADMDTFVSRYFKRLFRETCQYNSQPYSLYCLGVIHGAARKIPELLSYLIDKHPSLTVKTNIMEFKNDIQTITMAEYGNNVFKSYKNGLFRYGPMHAVSLVGRKGEETGGYFKDVIKYLERNPFLRQVMPWGPLTQSAGMSPDASNDGPILWVRHGEQAVPCTTNKNKKTNRLC